MWKAFAAAATAVVALVTSTYVIAQKAPVNQQSLAEQLVDAFNAVFGVHPGIRANHAKGVVLRAYSHRARRQRQ